MDSEKTPLPHEARPPHHGTEGGGGAAPPGTDDAGAQGHPLRHFSRVHGPRFDLERQRSGQGATGPPGRPMLGMSWEPFRLSGMNAAWVRPDRGHD